MDLKFRYVRDLSAVAHVWDHIEDRNDQALCGHEYRDPVELSVARRPERVCRRCQTLLPQAETSIWRRAAAASTSELRKVKREYRRLRDAYEDLWAEYEPYPGDYEQLRTDYESLWNDYEHDRGELDRVWDEYEMLWKAHGQVVQHAENQRRELRRLQQGKHRPSGLKGGVTDSASGAVPQAERASRTAPTNKLKKSAAGKINPSKRTPNGRPRVKFFP